MGRQACRRAPGPGRLRPRSPGRGHRSARLATRLDPTSELILTILTQNSADINAEVAFAALRAAYPSAPAPAGAADAEPRHFPGWGGLGLPDLPPPDWAAVEAAPIPELTDVIRPGGLANQKAPRIQAALRALVANGGSYSLEFLAEKPPLEARDWLSAIPGIGKKTASVVLLFSFGTPLMPVDRHVHRVSQRIGLIPAGADADAAHDYYLAMLTPGADVRDPRLADQPRPPHLPRPQPRLRALPARPALPLLHAGRGVVARPAAAGGNAGRSRAPAIRLGHAPARPAPLPTYTRHNVTGALAGR